MGRKISDIYTEYKIPSNLQKHMLRVAAVASLICDNFTEPLPKENIITACLLHDMGNIIKYDLNYFPEFNKPEGIEYWQNVQDEFIKKYGKNEHQANLKIIKELRLSQDIVNMVDNVNFICSCDYRNGTNFLYKIVNYADWRVDPHGIVSYEERMEEGERRYRNRKDNTLKKEDREKLLVCGKEIEKQIFAKCKIKPEDINNETAASLILELKNFVIHSIKTQAFGSETQARRGHGE